MAKKVESGVLGPFRSIREIPPKSPKGPPSAPTKFSAHALPPGRLRFLGLVEKAPLTASRTTPPCSR